MAAQVFSAWGTTERLAWSVPRGTRGYLVRNVLCPDITSARVDILAKYPSFFVGLRLSPSHEVAFMANLVSRDMRTVTGRNVRLLVDETGLGPMDRTLCRFQEGT